MTSKGKAMQPRKSGYIRAYRKLLKIPICFGECLKNMGLEFEVVVVIIAT